MAGLPQIPYAEIQATDDGFSAEPAEDSADGVQRFDQAIRAFMDTPSGWRLLEAHHSAETEVSMIDLAIFVHSDD